MRTAIGLDHRLVVQAYPYADAVSFGGYTRTFGVENFEAAYGSVSTGRYYFALHPFHSGEANVDRQNRLCRPESGVRGRWVKARVPHLLALGDQYPDLQLSFTIAADGDRVYVDGKELVLALSSQLGGRMLVATVRGAPSSYELLVAEDLAPAPVIEGYGGGWPRLKQASLRRSNAN